MGARFCILLSNRLDCSLEMRRVKKRDLTPRCRDAMFAPVDMCGAPTALEDYFSAAAARVGVVSQNNSEESRR